MTCPECTALRAHTAAQYKAGPVGKSSVTCPKCIYCAARRIQFVQRVMKVSKDDKVKRCREALQEAMDWGHAEQQVRQLAKSTDWACEPVRGKR